MIRGAGGVPRWGKLRHTYPEIVIIAPLGRLQQLLLRHRVWVRERHAVYLQGTEQERKCLACRAGSSWEGSAPGAWHHRGLRLDALRARVSNEGQERSCPPQRDWNRSQHSEGQCNRIYQNRPRPEPQTSDCPSKSTPYRGIRVCMQSRMRTVFRTNLLQQKHNPTVQEQGSGSTEHGTGGHLWDLHGQQKTPGESS